MKISRAAGDVKRYHCLRVHHQQTIAHHVWNIFRIYFAIWGTPSGTMTQHIILHDTEEYGINNNGTGDMPHHAKRRWPGLREILHAAEAELQAEMCPNLDSLTEEEAWRLGVCDMLEMWEFGMDEANMGNHIGHQVQQTAGRVVLQMLAAAEEKYDIAPVQQYMNGDIR